MAHTLAQIAKPKRRWLRFSLRTLLIVIMLSSLPLGWLAMKMVQAKRQRRAVEAIEEAGGWVQYDCVVDESSKPQPPVPAWLTGLVGADMFVDVVQVRILESEAPDMALEHLKELPKLKLLYLSGTQTDDAGLEHLKGLTNLKYLELDHTQISDAGLKHLNKLTNLKLLKLSGTQVAEGIQELQEALPTCEVVWDGKDASQQYDQP